MSPISLLLPIDHAPDACAFRINSTFMISLLISPICCSTSSWTHVLDLFSNPRPNFLRSLFPLSFVKRMYSNNKISVLIPSLAVTSSSSSPNRVQLQKGGQTTANHLAISLLRRVWSRSLVVSRDNGASGKRFFHACVTSRRHSPLTYRWYLHAAAIYLKPRIGGSKRRRGRRRRCPHQSFVPTGYRERVPLLP